MPTAFSIRLMLAPSRPTSLGDVVDRSVHLGQHGSGGFAGDSGNVDRDGRATTGDSTGNTEVGNAQCRRGKADGGIGSGGIARVTDKNVLRGGGENGRTIERCAGSDSVDLLIDLG